MSLGHRFIYLGFYVPFNIVQVISRRAVGRAEETSTYSWSRFCTVMCRPTASNYQLSHLRPCREPNSGLRGGRREFYHSVTVVLGHRYCQACSKTITIANINKQCTQYPLLLNLTLRADYIPVHLFDF